MSMSQYEIVRPAEIPQYVTIFGHYKVKNVDFYLHFHTGCMFRAGVHYLLNYVKSNGLPKPRKGRYGIREALGDIAYEVVPDRKYAVGCGLIIEEIWKSCQKLGIDIRDVELNDWLMFQSPGSKHKTDKGNRNIRLIAPDQVEIKLFNEKKQIITKTFNFKPERGYVEFFEYLSKAGLNGEYGYNARVYMDVDKVLIYREEAYCELQIAVDTWLYLQFKKKFDKPIGNRFGAIDFNDDRLNASILEVKNGNVIEVYNVKTFWFPDVTSGGYPKERKRTRICQAFHDCLMWMWSNGVSTVFTEDPEKLGVYKIYWIKQGKRRNENWNYKVSIFSSSYLYDFPLYALEYGMRTYWVDPYRTSEDAKQIEKIFGLDNDTCASIIIGITGITYLPKQKLDNKNHQLITTE